MEHEGRKINPCHHEKKMGGKECCHIGYEKKNEGLKLITKSCQKIGKLSKNRKIVKKSENCEKPEKIVKKSENCENLKKLRKLEKTVFLH